MIVSTIIDKFYYRYIIYKYYIYNIYITGVSVSKYYITKRLPGFMYECMEIMGGNGYVEDFQMAKLFRQVLAPLKCIYAIKCA